MLLGIMVAISAMLGLLTLIPSLAEGKPIKAFSLGKGDVTGLSPAGEERIGYLQSWENPNNYRKGQATIGYVTPSGLSGRQKLPRRLYRSTRMAIGGDGTLWTASCPDDRLGIVNPSGRINVSEIGNCITDFDLSPSGQVWAVTNQGNVFPADSEEVWGSPSFKVPAWNGYQPVLGSVAAGPDSNVWFDFDNAGDSYRCRQRHMVARWHTQSRRARYFNTGMPPHGRRGSRCETYAGIQDLKADGKGNVWFTEYSSQKIGRVGSGGKVRRYRTKGSFPEILTVATDGSIWYGATVTGRPRKGIYGTSIGRIGHVKPNGRVTEYPVPRAHSITAIQADERNHVWFGFTGAKLNGHIGLLDTSSPPGRARCGTPVKVSKHNRVFDRSNGRKWCPRK